MPALISLTHSLSCSLSLFPPPPTPLSVDKPMQMNQALFMLNGKSGYVLQPSIMRDDNFDPFDRHTLRGVEAVTLVIEVKKLLEIARIEEWPR